MTGDSRDEEMGRWGDAHRDRFLILSVEAGPGRQGGIVDKEDFIQKMYFGFAQYKVC